METNHAESNNKELTVYDSMEKVDKLNRRAEELLRNIPIKAIEISKEASELSRQIHYEEGAVQSLFAMGKASYTLGNFEEAISFLMDALQITKKENFKKYEADVLNVLGNVNLDLANHNVALEFYMKALEIVRQIGYEKNESRVLNNIGEIYKTLNNYETALEYYTQSLQICNSINDEGIKCIVLLNIGEIHCYLNSFDLAKEYTERSLELSCNVKDRMVESASLHQLGKICIHQKNENEAMNLFLRSLEISKETGERYFIIGLMIDIHELLKKKGNNDEAIEYLKNALNLAYEINSKEMIMKIHSYLAEIHERIGQFDKALYYYKKFHDKETNGLNSKLENKLKNITLQFKIEKSQQEKEIYRLKNVELKEKTDALEKKTTELMESYNNMRIISEIGQGITSTLDFEKILELAYKSINSLMVAYTFGFALYDKATGDIEYRLFIENSKRYPISTRNIRDKNNWAAWCILNKKEILINDAEKEYKHYIKDRNIIYGLNMESIIYCPLIFEDNVLGVITVQSMKKNAYSQYNLDTIKALASYIAIAMRNSQKSYALENLNKKLLGLSKLDGLTGIPNRRHFDEEIEIELHKAKNNKYPLSLMLIDVDSFKEYNDNYGHLAGDYCLQEIAKVLQSVSDEGKGFVARYGGDEFVAVFPNTDAKNAIYLGEAMKNRMNALNIEHQFSKVVSHVTFTIGISTIIPDENLTVSDLIASSDKALYVAKQKGRNRIEAC